MRIFQIRIIAAAVFLVIAIVALLDHWFYWDKVLSQETYGTLSVVSFLFGAHYTIKALEELQGATK